MSVGPICLGGLSVLPVDWWPVVGLIHVCPSVWSVWKVCLFVCRCMKPMTCCWSHSSPSVCLVYLRGLPVLCVCRCVKPMICCRAHSCPAVYLSGLFGASVCLARACCVNTSTRMGPTTPRYVQFKPRETTGDHGRPRETTDNQKVRLPTESLNRDNIVGTRETTGDNGRPRETTGDHGQPNSASPCRKLGSG